MPFFAIGAIAVSALSAGASASSNNKVAAQNYINSLKADEATNKAIAEANLANTIRTGYRAGILNVQRGQAKQQAVQQGYDISVKAGQALGQSQANAAASGTTGASVDAVMDDIKRKTDQAQGEVDEAFEDTQLNFDTQLNDMIQQGIDTLQSAKKSDTQGPAFQDVGNAMLLGGIQSAVGFATQYGVAKMNLGLGPAPTQPVTGGGLVNNGSRTSGFRTR